MKNAILAKVEESFQKAEKFYNRTFVRPNHYLWKRKGTTAGHSNWGKRELMFQLDLAEANKEDFLSQTVPHEVAHFVQRQMYPFSSAHGREWKYIMRYVMGLDPDRCHMYDVSVTQTRKVRRIEYKCNCKVHKITLTLHNKIQKGEWRRCLRCNTRIVLNDGAVIPEYVAPAKIVKTQLEQANAEIEKLRALLAQKQNS